MSGLIGYYVHHQGEGHRRRAAAIARHAPERFVLIGSGLEENGGGLAQLVLEDDRPLSSTRFDSVAQDCLHYVPLQHEGVRRRVATLAQWIAQNRPALLVIDVSVEIAMLARLASVPTVYVRLGGVRDDPPHLQAFRSALSVMAPFHADLDDESVPRWVRDKTRYLPGLTTVGSGAAVNEDLVLCVNGQGGGALDGTALAQAAAATPDLTWRVIGPAAPPSGQCPPNLTLCGWVDDADDQIASAGVVIGSTGDAVVSAVLAAGRPYLCLPQARPYAEQAAKARRLAALGAAVVLERMPTAFEWPTLIERLRRLSPSAIARLHDAHGLQKACAYLLATAEGQL